MPDRVPTEVEGHRVVLSSLEKVLWPTTGMTKGEALRYYAQVAPALLPHVRRRPASFVRFPSGVEGERFYTKNPPPGLPDWVPLVAVPGHEGTKPHVALDSLAALMTMANLYALELHVPQWTAETGPDLHDRLVVDLDPGEGADIVDCCRVALWARRLLSADGLSAWPKTSGSKGIHVLVPLVPAPADAVVAYAKDLAQRLEAAHPRDVVAVMAKDRRHGRVFLDAGQNRTSKTTAAPYSLRARPTPAVSTPISWAEVAACRDAVQLEFTPQQVLDRITNRGDLIAPLTDPKRACRLR